MNCLTWNLEWASPKSRPAKLIMELVTATEPDVICFTEALVDLMPHGHLIKADPDYGYPIIKGRWKVHQYVIHDEGLHIGSGLFLCPSTA